MANINKIQVENVLYDIEDTTARSSAVTMSSRADGSVSLSSASAGTSVNVPSLTNFGDPSELDNDVVTEINDLKTEVSELKSQITNGIPAEVKLAMDTLFANAMYINGDVYAEEISLIHTWATAVNLLSISAVFDQGENVIYNTDSLEDLRQYLTVTASYDNGTSAEVSAYTLSGELTVGTSIITAEYNGKSASFSVTVTADPWSIKWDYTEGIPSADDGWTTGGTGSITLESDGVLFKNTANGQTCYAARSTDYTATHGIAEFEFTPILSPNVYQGVFISLSTGSVGCRLRVYNSKLYYGSATNTQATDTKIADLTLNTRYTLFVEYSAESVTVKLDGETIHTEANPAANPTRFVFNNTEKGHSIKLHSIKFGEVS